MSGAEPGTLSGAGVGAPAQSKGVPPQPVHLYVAFYAAVTLLWMWSLPRLLYGILPFLLAFMLLGLASAADWVSALLRRSSIRPAPFATALVAFVVFVSFVANVAASLRIGDSRDHTPDLTAGTAWIKADSPADSIVLATNPEVTYVYTDRQGLPLVGSVDAIDPALAAAGGSERPAYLLLAPDLVWRDDGALEVSPWVSSLAAELSASPHASLAYADAEQQMYVYAWLPSGGSQ